MGFEKWVEESGVARRIVARVRRQLLGLEMVYYDPVMRKYGLTDSGGRFSAALSDSEFLRRNLPDLVWFSVHVPGSGKKRPGEDSLHREHAHRVSLHHDRSIGLLRRFFERRAAEAVWQLLREILRLGAERKLLRRLPPDEPPRLVTVGMDEKRRPRKVPVLLFDVRRISPKTWRKIFKAVSPGEGELIYLERVNLKLLEYSLAHPETREELSEQAAIRR